MARKNEEQNTVRQYLLRHLSDSEAASTELQILSDDATLEELEIVEDELIDEYLAGELSEDERVNFEQIFLANPERQRKLAAGQALQRYFAEVSPQPAPTHKLDPKPSRLDRLLKWLRNVFSLPRTVALGSPPIMALAMLVIAVFGFGIWRAVFYQSDVDKGLVALNAAYSQRRPIEARISKFDYAPFVTTRGDQSERVNSRERDRAERILLDAVRDNPGAPSYHALGKFYLAKKDLDKAVQNLTDSLKSDPANPDTYADLGAAYLEKGQLEIEKGKFQNDSSESGRGFEDLARSQENLSKALQLNPLQSEALFNRALCLEYLLLPQKAKEAWQAYLNHDSKTEWADEARRRLATLTNESATAPTPAELMDSFLAAVRDNDDDRAWRLLSQNREFITGRMLPPQLARAYTTASLGGQTESAQTFLRAFVHAGELDRQRGGDPYTAELARYYSGVSPAQRQLLANAQKNIDQGYKLCLETRYTEAVAGFAEARQQFKQAGDLWEAVLADYWLSYCYTQLDRIAESIALLKSVAEFCEPRQHKWLLAQAEGWLATNYSILSEHSNAIKYYRQSLALATTINDTYQMQKTLTELGAEHLYLQQPNLSLGYYYRSLSLAGESAGSPRQAWRNLLYTTSAFFNFHYYETAIAFGGEALQLGKREFNDPSLSYMSQLNLGQIYSRLGRFDDAISHAKIGLETAQTVLDPAARKKSTAAALLKQAQIWRDAGDNREALQFFEQAIALYDGMKFDLYRYVAYKGKVLAALALNDQFTFEQNLPLLLDMFERNRAQIREEQFRNSFFDTEQDVYDIAVEHEYQKGNLSQAINYAEASHSRSLLASLHHSPGPARAPTSDQFSTAVYQPVDVDSITRLLPVDLKILMFTVLPHRLLIWNISHEGISASHKEISADVLKANVLTYVQAVNEGTAASLPAVAARKQLYETLVGSLGTKNPPGTKLCIIPDKFLFQLPFAALASPATGRYLIEDWSIFYAPSLNVMWDCSQEAEKHSRSDQGPLVSIGNPSFNQETYPLASLAAAEREVKGIGRNFSKPTCLLGAAANKKDVLRAMQTAEVVHFAGHYVLDNSDPLLSKMLLASGGRIRRRKTPS